jgi:HEPN domain-containing protein
MANRANDWLKQAKRDLKQARILKNNQGYEWACFLAQQSAEKALKALHLFLGQEAWGHTISKLLTELPIKFPKKLIDKAKILDAFYIPTRYPNGFPEGTPYEHYGKSQAEEAIKYASEIIKFVNSKMAK